MEESQPSRATGLWGFHKQTVSFDLFFVFSLYQIRWVGKKSSWCIFWRTEFSGIKKCSWQHDTRLTATITT